MNAPFHSDEQMPLLLDYVETVAEAGVDGIILPDPALLRSGIGGLKLVGRGAPTAQKVKNVLLVRELLELASAEEDFDLYRRKAIDAHRRRFGVPCSPNVCYYPEFYRSE